MIQEVTLFRDFIEDRRLSMEIYSDHLSWALRSITSKHFLVREYRPRKLKWLGDGVWPMRLARFALYPLQARRQQVQLTHILDHGYGHLVFVLNPARTVITVHDLIPLLRWRGKIPGVSAYRRPWLNLLSFKGLKKAAHIISVSENTKQDLIRYCGVSPERITVIPYGIDPAYRPYTSDEKNAARKKWNLLDDGTKRILIAGSGFYKNQPAAVRAFVRLKRSMFEPIQLIKVGEPDDEWDELIHEHHLHESSVCFGVVPSDEMPEIYNIVDCLLFPSFYEGFGRPPLEAMACGTPVVASNSASLPEVIVEAGLLCAPDDIECLAHSLKNALTDSELRQSLIARGLSRAAQFTWQETARRTLEIYERVAEVNQNAYRY